MNSDQYENFLSRLWTDRSEFIVKSVSGKHIKRNVWRPKQTRPGLSSSRAHVNTPEHANQELEDIHRIILSWIGLVLPECIALDKLDAKLWLLP